MKKLILVLIVSVCCSAFTVNAPAQQADRGPHAYRDSERVIDVPPGPSQAGGGQDSQRRQVGQGEAKVLPRRTGVKGVHDRGPADDQHKVPARPLA